MAKKDRCSAILGMRNYKFETHDATAMSRGISARKIGENKSVLEGIVELTDLTCFL